NVVSSHMHRYTVNSFVSLFFVMLRRPPRSTLFPTRRSSDLGRGVYLSQPVCLRHGVDRRTVRFASRSGHRPGAPGGLAAGWRLRSEEHTSELQSRENLVCRLLLEKKKTSQAEFRRKRSSIVA